MDKDKILKDLGSKVRDRRIELGISQKELGLRCNKDQQAINRLETGGINPSYIQLLEVCTGLNLTIDELLKKQ